MHDTEFKGYAGLIYYLRTAHALDTKESRSSYLSKLTSSASERNKHWQPSRCRLPGRVQRTEFNTESALFSRIMKMHEVSERKEAKNLASYEFVTGHWSTSQPLESLWRLAILMYTRRRAKICHGVE